MVDRTLQSSAKNVYALGDCMEVEGLNLPFIMPIMHGARTLAKVLNGETALLSYPAMPVMIKTKSCPVIVSPPNKDTQGEWQHITDNEGIKGLYQGQDGALLGFVLAGQYTKQKQALTKQLPAVL
jgi:rubredoxin---NAD+ reductase